MIALSDSRSVTEEGYMFKTPDGKYLRTATRQTHTGIHFDIEEVEMAAGTLFPGPRLSGAPPREIERACDKMGYIPHPVLVIRTMNITASEKPFEPSESSSVPA